VRAHGTWCNLAIQGTRPWGNIKALEGAFFSFLASILVMLPSSWRPQMRAKRRRECQSVRLARIGQEMRPPAFALISVWQLKGGK
jgi:hypothetical protein